MSPHLDDANPHEDASRNSVEGADGDDSRRIVAVELLENTNADAHANRSDEGETGSQEELLLERNRLGNGANLD